MKTTHLFVTMSFGLISALSSSQAQSATVGLSSLSSPCKSLFKNSANSVVYGDTDRRIEVSRQIDGTGSKLLLMVNYSGKLAPSAANGSNLTDPVKVKVSINNHDGGLYSMAPAFGGDGNQGALSYSTAIINKADACATLVNPDTDPFQFATSAESNSSVQPPALVSWDIVLEFQNSKTGVWDNGGTDSKGNANGYHFFFSDSVE